MRTIIFLKYVHHWQFRQYIFQYYRYSLTFEDHNDVILGKMLKNCKYLATFLPTLLSWLPLRSIDQPRESLISGKNAYKPWSWRPGISPGRSKKPSTYSGTTHSSTGTWVGTCSPSTIISWSDQGHDPGHVTSRKSSECEQDQELDKTLQSIYNF